MTRTPLARKPRAVVYRRAELRTCARRGHATYRPDEVALADRLRVATAAGEVWRCLRCGDFVTGEPEGHGPADRAPLVLRGKALRAALIVRLLSVERGVRALLLLAAAYAVLRFSSSQQSIQAALEKDVPAFRSLGINVDQFALYRELQKLLVESPQHFRLIALLLLAYAAVEAVEAVGLWLTARWGEYFAAVATAVFLPFEVEELTKSVTATKVGALLLNIAAVVYLLVSKRLFGIRGGGHAYEAERRGEQLLEVEQAGLGA